MKPVAIRIAIADYLENHKNKWCYIEDMARELLGYNTAIYRNQIKNNIGNARMLIEEKGYFVIPYFEPKTKGVERYKIATLENAQYIIEELARKSKRYETAKTKLLNAVETTKDNNLLNGNHIKQIPTIEKIPV